MTKNEILLLSVFAALWAFGGLAIGVALEQLFGVQWTLTCMSLNVLIGVMLVLLITHDEHARRIFYEGPKEGEAGLPIIGFLWAMPPVMPFVGVLWWILAQFLE